MIRNRSSLRAAILILAAAGVILSLYGPVAAVAGAVGSIGAPWGDIALLALNSALLALISGAVATALGSLIALLVWECMSLRPKRLLSGLIYMTAGIPSMVTALAVLMLLGDRYGTIHVVVAMVLSIAPYAARYMLEDLEALSPYTLLTLHALGASGPRMIWHGILPSARRPALATFLFTTARAFAEVPVLTILLGTTPRFLPMQLVLAPLSPAAFPAALVMMAGAMLLYDRARALHGG